MKDYIRYAVSVLSVVLVIVLLVVSFNLIKGALKSKPADNSTNQTNSKVKTKNLLDAGKAGETVQYTVRGSINSEEDHREIRFTVSPSVRRVEVIQGYNQKVIKTQELANNTESYNAFIAALNGAGFTKQLSADGRGTESQSCPIGRVYSYSVGADFRTWAASCNGKLGTFDGSNGLIQTLFREQFPDYSKFISGVRLS